MFRATNTITDKNFKILLNPLEKQPGSHSKIMFEFSSKVTMSSNFKFNKCAFSWKLNEKPIMT